MAWYWENENNVRYKVQYETYSRLAVIGKSVQLIDVKPTDSKHTQLLSQSESHVTGDIGDISLHAANNIKLQFY